MKKKLLAIALLPFIFGGCSRSPNHPINNPPPINCQTIDYGNGVYYVTGDDFGVCLARFVGERIPEERISFAAFTDGVGNAPTKGYFVIVR